MVNKKLTEFPDTIYALASGSLPSGVAVIRVSGSRTRTVLGALAGSIPKPRHAELRVLRDGSRILDQALVLFFSAPASFTGEDVAEFHIHGGRAVAQAVLEAIGAIGECRVAEAGEFTRRAFLNGKIDLTGAEALADLVGAETEAQRRFAMTGVAGEHRGLYTGWQKRMTRARALIEADLDFSDEQVLPGSVAETVWNDMTDLSEEIVAHLAGVRSGEIIRDGYRVVLIGAPNAGKSSLLNCLARREVAIVTEEAGTTRDLIDVALDISGHKVIVTDTAGLRNSDSQVEKIGIRKAVERGGEADLVLYLTDMSAPVEVFGLVRSGDALSIGAKVDLVGAENTQGVYDIKVSAVTGEGIPALLDLIGLKAMSATSGEDLFPARLRHVEYLTRSRKSLESAIQDHGVPIELRAEMLRAAADDLGRITGNVDVEDLLDVIFSEFCIGK